MQDRRHGRAAPSRRARALICLLPVILLAASGHGVAQEQVVVRPQDIGEALVNPGMGWVHFHYDNSIGAYGVHLEPWDTVDEFPGLSTIYLRLAWSYIEPIEGRFDWSVVDTPTRKWARRGKQVAFRFTCCETGIPYATPKWVRDAGARGHEFEPGKGLVEGGNFWEPDYGDPIFLQKLEAFLKAAAVRYDGSPDVAFVDIGSFGTWGEGHTGYASSRQYSIDVKRRHIDLHVKHFPRTPIVANDDFLMCPQKPIQAAGEYDLPCAFSVPEGSRDKSLTVLGGLWIPGNEELPEGRLLPMGGDEDRRVNLGTLAVDGDGACTFEVAASSHPRRTEGVFQLLTGGRLALRSTYPTPRYVLHMSCKVREALPHGVQAFMHFVGPDGIEFGGWRDHSRELLDYARGKGLSIRDDSVLYRDSITCRPDWAEGIWEHRPVVLESVHWGPEARDGEGYYVALEEFHASYMGIHWYPRDFLKRQRDLVDRANLRMGYRLQLVEASWPAQVQAGGAMSFTSKWRNAGVAPCYPGGFPAITLVGPRGGINAVFTDENFDMGRLPVGPPRKAPIVDQYATFSLPFCLKPGMYDLCVSVGTRTGHPVIALPLDGANGERRYKIGSIRITGDYEVQAGELENGGPQQRLAFEWTISHELAEGVVPFVHLERDGAIVASGRWLDLKGKDFTQPGTVQTQWLFELGERARGRTYSLKTGLWIPGDRGRAYGRLLPSGGATDRRVTIGTLEVSLDGQLTLLKDAEAPEPTERH